MVDLSIVIPTYNRHEWIATRIRSLHDLLADSGISYEIVVSDNHSSPAWNPAAETGIPADAPLRVIMPERHSPTAEGNYFFALTQCEGCYIWVMGDDDPPNRYGVGRLVELVKDGGYNLLLFDSNRYRLDGTLTNGSIGFTGADNLKSIGEFIKHGGFWFTLAGFSNTVFRAPSQEDLATGRELFGISPIYSHAFWLVCAFWEKPFRFTSVPLVTYCESSRDGQDSDFWDSFAAKSGVSKSYHWTTGFVRQAKYLREKLGLPKGWFADVWDLDWNGDKRALLSTVAIIFWNEIVGTPRMARAMTRDEMMEIVVFMVEENPKFEILASLLKKAGFDASALKSDSRKGDIFIKALHENKLFDYFIEYYRSWNIYCIHGRYLALHDSVLSSYRSSGRDYFVGNSSSGLSAEDLPRIKQLVDECIEKDCHRPENSNGRVDLYDISVTLKNLEKNIADIRYELVRNNLICKIKRKAARISRFIFRR